MSEQSACLEGKWSFGPDVPTTDFFERRDLNCAGDLEWLVLDLIEPLRRHEFLHWEAVV